MYMTTLVVVPALVVDRRVQQVVFVISSVISLTILSGCNPS